MEPVTLTFRVTDEGTLEILDKAAEKLGTLDSEAARSGEGMGGFSKAMIVANQTLELFEKGLDLAHDGVEKLMAEVERADRINKLSQEIGFAVEDLTALSVSAR